MPKIIAQKEDWITLGYRLFAQKGVEGIVVEKMAQTLTCNKSSFYWHFKTKKDFIDAIINFWTEQETYFIIQQTNEESKPIKQLEKLITLAFKKDPNIDFVFYLKRYAKNKPPIQKIIDNIDEARMKYVAQLLEKIGNTP